MRPYPRVRTPCSLSLNLSHSNPIRSKETQLDAPVKLSAEICVVPLTEISPTETLDEQLPPYPAAHPMATRRSHTKSRTGCRDCKRRKVKVSNRVPPAVLRLRAPNTRVEGSGVRVRWSDGTLPTLLFPPARCGVEELSLTDRVSVR